MKIDVITKEDLADLKMQLIEEIKILLQPQKNLHKQWLRSAEVRKMLNISPGTLQNLRINGMLPFTKVGSIAYYDIIDIEKMMQKGGSNVQLVRKTK
ncbi:helix-turn-helix domain-containing protein [Pedobacter agri]|uniref:helix-turn-helix domain-containing protein n=1 Tax=Pedobacter agri TaxID=454586 RepID=UPI00292F767C|nr:helix-turn-helix domain-containing protein [Pedobacter agri]